MRSPLATRQVSLQRMPGPQWHDPADGALTSPMLFANRCTWDHMVAAATEALAKRPEDLLSPEELNAVRSQGDPRSPSHPRLRRRPLAGRF